LKIVFEKTLVTGADGFIGSHLVEQMVRQNRNIRAFVMYNSRNSRGWLDSLPQDVRDNLDVYAGDVRDQYNVRTAMEGCDSVVHLAALIGIPYSYAAAQSYVETNVMGTLNILQAARDLEVAKVVHTSTSEVYGTALTVPINEDHRLLGQSPYAATKIGADQMAIAYFLTHGLPVSVVRPFNTYGPRQSTRAVIPTIITQITKGSRTIQLGSLSPTRDFGFVLDTVSGFIAALDAPGAIGEVVNLGSGYEISIGDVAALIAELMHVDVEISNDPMRVRPPEGEVERLLSDNTKAAGALDWRPGYAGRDGLARGLMKTIDWFSDDANIAHYINDGYQT